MTQRGAPERGVHDHPIDAVRERDVGTMDHGRVRDVPGDEDRPAERIHQRITREHRVDLLSTDRHCDTGQGVKQPCREHPITPPVSNQPGSRRASLQGLPDAGRKRLHATDRGRVLARDEQWTRGHARTHRAGCVAAPRSCAATDPALSIVRWSACRFAPDRSSAEPWRPN